MPQPSWLEEKIMRKIDKNLYTKNLSQRITKCIDITLGMVVYKKHKINKMFSKIGYQEVIQGIFCFEL